MSEKENLRQELLDLNKKRDEIEKQILSYQSVLKSVRCILSFSVGSVCPAECEESSASLAPDHPKIRT